MLDLIIILLGLMSLLGYIVYKNITNKYYVVGAIVTVALFIFISWSNCNCKERFEIQREQKPGGPVLIGTIPNSPEPIKNLTKDLNDIGMQLVADSEYDKVPTEFLK